MPRIQAKNDQVLLKSRLIQMQSQGFTLLELLVVIIIVSILSATALPMLLNQVGKAREVEAKEALSAIAYSQQAYFFENGEFADNMQLLDLTLNPREYSYPAPQRYVTASTEQVIHVANAINPINRNIRDYALGVYNTIGGSQGFGMVLCQSERPGMTALPFSTPTASIGDCEEGEVIK